MKDSLVEGVLKGIVEAILFLILYGLIFVAYGEDCATGFLEAT